MKRLISLTLVALMFVFSLLFATDAEQAEGIQATKAKMSSIISQANQRESTTNERFVKSYNNLSSIKTKLDSNYYSKTASTSDYTKSKTMEMLSQLATTAAFAIGTADQAKQAALISDQATALKAAGAPEYQEIATKYADLAEAVKSGNDIQAQSIAASITDYVTANAPVIDSNYTPTPQENSLLAGLGSVLSGSLGRIGSMLTSFGLSKLLTLLGGAALASNPLTLAIGMLMGDTIGALASSVTNNGVVNWEPVANSATDKTTSLTSGGANSAEGKLGEALNTNLAQTTPLTINTNTNAVVEGS